MREVICAAFSVYQRKRFLSCDLGNGALIVMIKIIPGKVPRFLSVYVKMTAWISIKRDWKTSGAFKIALFSRRLDFADILKKCYFSG